MTCRVLSKSDIVKDEDYIRSLTLLKRIRQLSHRCGTRVCL